MIGPTLAYLPFRILTFHFPMTLNLATFRSFILGQTPSVPYHYHITHPCSLTAPRLPHTTPPAYWPIRSTIDVNKDTSTTHCKGLRYILGLE
ncbi:hypothetical protein M378DRAFT_994799 [Amanita muscaria Koide BX008]|uniref:Uncharacterized protein n=1 Tax=Amanita muscaria (strain Koide BX008) TaxID=946122 RepID=A0A0C2XGG6_AMAMK|nr:hypothetical protein M378DRAFT_994799 [Amanita muscaria Koide BX008]